MKYFRFFYFIFLWSCVTPYDISSTDYTPTLVVQGLITDQPGPYLVKLTMAQPITSQPNSLMFVTGATVTIYDDEGTTETLLEKSPGNYYTSSIQGAVGRTYYITITTQEGHSYKSSPEKMIAVGDFSLTSEFQINEDPNISRQITSTNGFDVYLNSDLLPEQGGRVWWRWSGTFKIETHPELQTKPAPGPPSEATVPDPPKCSGYYSDHGDLTPIGYIHIPAHGTLTKIGPTDSCTCCTCWVTEYNQSPLISDLSFTNNNQIKNQQIGFVQANVRTFYEKYILQVEQLSVSQNIYDFWKRVKIQQGNSSSLFQVPPPKVKGNLYATSQNAGAVIGYFAAASQKTHTLVFNRSDVPYAVQLIDTVKYSCLIPYSNSTNVKPLFW